MKAGVKILLAASGIGLLYLLTKKASTIIDPTDPAIDIIKSIKLKISSFRIAFPKIYISVQVFNPLNKDIYIDSIVGSLSFNGNAIGNIQYISTTPIRALSNTTLKDLPVILSPEGILTLSTQIIDKQVSTGNFTFTGKIYYKGVPFPFSESIKVF